MRRRSGIVLLAAVVCGCAGSQEAQVPGRSAPQPPAAAGRVLGRGPASWYGLDFHGRRTASGERFDMHAFTAAHPWLPFGTRVEVHNPANGRRVTVRINDRGPHTGGRIIDLSHAAARALGILGFGVRPVVITATDGTPAEGPQVP